MIILHIVGFSRLVSCKSWLASILPTAERLNAPWFHFGSGKNSKPNSHWKVYRSEWLAVCEHFGEEAGVTSLLRQSLRCHTYGEETGLKDRGHCLLVRSILHLSADFYLAFSTLLEGRNLLQAADFADPSPLSDRVWRSYDIGCDSAHRLVFHQCRAIQFPRGWGFSAYWC